MRPAMNSKSKSISELVNELQSESLQTLKEFFD